MLTTLLPKKKSFQAGAGGPVQADRTSIYFWRQVNVRRCREIWSSSKSKVRWCENFSVIF